MTHEDLRPLFEGSNDERLLHMLYRRIETARNPSQADFVFAWEIITFLHSDGFECLLEQQWPWGEYSATLERVGMRHVRPIFDEVWALLPTEYRDAPRDDRFFEYVRGKFDELNALASKFYDAAADFPTTLAQFVREHRANFSEFDQSE